MDRSQFWLSSLKERGHSPLSLNDLSSALNELKKLGHRVTQTTLEIKAEEAARSLTLSKKYGAGRFPFHSDFAFRAIPPRHIVLCNLSDRTFKRRTLVCVLDELSDSLRSQIEKCSWNLMTTKGLCVVDGRFRFAGRDGTRWDCDFLQPANHHANEAVSIADNEMLRHSSAFDWQPHSALIIDNWRCTHSREQSPDCDTDTHRKLVRYEAWDNGRVVSR